MDKPLGIELRKLNNLVAREISKNGNNFPRGHLTEMHANIVDYIMKSGEKGVMQKDIEEAFTIRKSTASRILKLMESHGIIERHSVDYDARLKRIQLAPVALRHHQQIRARVDELENRITKDISEQDLETFLRVIKKMQQNLEE